LSISAAGVLTMVLVTVIVTVFLFVYLGAALMRPEWF
jgi:K+-transporting ATPase KdpF subunit